MFFMEILMDYLWDFFPTDTAEYKVITRSEQKLLEQLQALAGDDLMEKLADTQTERLAWEYRHYFLCGLRLGIELLRLQSG